MKSFKKIAALVALLVTAPVLWAAPRSAQEYDQEAQEYKEYWLASVQKHKDEKNGVLLYLEELNFFCKEHPQCLLSHIELAAELLKIRNTGKGIDILKEAKKILSSVPDSEEGKFAKAKYYRLLAEVNLFITADEPAAKTAAKNCVNCNELLGAQTYYMFANYYANKKANQKAVWTFISALSYDKNAELLTQKDIETFLYCCKKGNAQGLISSFLNKVFEAKGASYFVNMGAITASGYESGFNKKRAVLVSMLDKECTKAYSDTNADELIDILKKHYGSSGKDVAACIDFVQKFFDDEKSLGDADLNSLPQKERDFLTVRYMFKMKNSNDVAALRDEFESFFGTMKQFYIRLLKKAESNGDKDSAAQINKILAEKFQNKKEG